MVLFLMPIKLKDTDYLQKKQSKNESSEESKKKKKQRDEIVSLSAQSLPLHQIPQYLL